MDSTTYLNRYQICRGEDGQPLALQRGPGGVTYRAEDIESDQAVAVKLVPAYSFAPPELQQLESEARAAQQVNHPNVARLHDFGFQGGDVVFVTELLEGSTLDAWVSEHGPLPAPAVVRVALQVVEGLAAAAFHSVTHRFIQPATLMIVPGQTPEGEWPLVKVLNFGGVPPTLTASEFVSGRAGNSADFASPEQLKGYPVDFRSELYSLGCTMWFLLTGAPPAPGNVDKAGRVPKPLRPILAQLVSLDPMQRPQDPVALQEQLRDCLAVLERREAIGKKFGIPVAAPAKAASDAAPNTTQLLKPLALAAAVLLLVGIAALAVPRLFRSNDTAAEPIGVPVGVPDRTATAPPIASQDNTAVASQTTTAPATPTTANVVAQSAAPVSSPIAAASAAPSAPPEQALVSVESPAPASAEDSAANQTTAPAVENGIAQPSTLAANDTPQPSSNASAQPAIGTQVADSGGGSAANSNVSPVRSGTTSRSDSPPRANSSQTDSSAASEKAAPVAEKSPARAAVAQTTPKPVKKVVRDEVRPAEPVDREFVNAPPVPRGTKRAKFLGTTPEGDLIFGLPSDQRGYVAPPAERRTRRTRRVAEPASDPERVLPAEPLDPQ